MEEAKCPYCKAPYAEEDGKCKECRALFPWATEAAKLRDELKEREVNRGRATFTLIEEVFSAAKGGKPVSAAALKGFAFAWLFPRTMIVIGSIITVIVVLLQTGILYRQTQLLEGQTLAAQVDQAEKLRARITKTVASLSFLQLLLASANRPPELGCLPECADDNLVQVISAVGSKRVAGGLGVPGRPLTSAEFALAKVLSELEQKVELWGPDQARRTAAASSNQSLESQDAFIQAVKEATGTAAEEAALQC